CGPAKRRIEVATLESGYPAGAGCPRGKLQGSRRPWSDGGELPPDSRSGRWPMRGSSPAMKRRVVSWAAALALGVGLGPAARGGHVTITGTGRAARPTTGKDVFPAPGVQPDQAAQSSWITKPGWVNGWAVKARRLDYNKVTDTMQVGVNFYTIAGDSSGNPAG